MRKVFTSALILIGLSVIVSCSQPLTGAARTASARAAYGNSVPLKAHARKNNKKKKNAQRAAKRKKSAKPGRSYQRLPM